MSKNDVTISNHLAKDLCLQLAAVRGTISDEDVGDWYQSALGKLYSILVQETGSHRDRSATTNSTVGAKNARKTISTKFKRR